jgi:hypothetical protein
MNMREHADATDQALEVVETCGWLDWGAGANHDYCGDDRTDESVGGGRRLGMR